MNHCNANTNKIINNFNEGTAIMKAVEVGQIDVVNFLLTTDTDANIKNNKGDSCLTIAARVGDYDMFSLLLSSLKPTIDVNEPNKKGVTYLMEACRAGNDDIITMLLECDGIDTNSQDVDGWTAIMHATDKNNVSCLQLLLPICDLELATLRGNTCFIIAAQKGHFDCCVMLAPHCNINSINAVGDNAINWAAHRGHTELVQYLLTLPG